MLSSGTNPSIKNTDLQITAGSNGNTDKAQYWVILYPTTNGWCTVQSNIVTLTINSPATVTPGGPDNVCQSAEPSAITLSGASVGGGATTGAWSIISGGGTLSNPAQTPSPGTVTYTPPSNYSGNITLRLTTNDIPGCGVASGDRIITVNPLPTASASKTDVSCFNGNNGSVTITPTSGSANYTYALNPGGFSSGPQAGAFTFSGLITNNYTWTMTDGNSCSTSPYTYSVDASLYSTTTVYNNLAASSHTIDVKDANGCIFSTSRATRANTSGGPTAIAFTDSSQCFMRSFQLIDNSGSRDGRGCTIYILG